MKDVGEAGDRTSNPCVTTHVRFIVLPTIIWTDTEIKENETLKQNFHTCLNVVLQLFYLFINTTVKLGYSELGYNENSVIAK